MQLPRRTIGFTLLGLTCLSGQALADEGKTIFETMGCMACHGPEGKKPLQPTYPKLAGQNKSYLVQQITDIASGARSNGQTSLMKGIAAGLSTAQIDAVAAYLSGLK